MKFFQKLGLVTSFVPTAPGIAPATPILPTRTKKLDRTGRILMNAVKLIDERGWVQREEVDLQGRLCIIGALRLAARAEFMGSPWYRKMFWSLSVPHNWEWKARERIGALPEVKYEINKLRERDLGSFCVSRYNDMPQMTVGQVTHVMRKAATT